MQEAGDGVCTGSTAFAQKGDGAKEGDYHD